MASAEEFKQYLIDQGVELPGGVEHSSDWAGTGNAIGAIALRLGMLQLGQIDQILAVQEEQERRLFGQIAVAEGILTEVQIERLLAVQKMHHCVEHVEMLAMHQGLELPLLLAKLAAFYQGK